MTSPTGRTRLFPIIGDPVTYVESPTRLTRTLQARGRDAVCIPMLVPAGDLDTVMAGLTASRNVDGVLITMPHKFAAYGHCATSSDRAKMLGVVSVIRRNPDGSWHGDMLDGVAFVNAQTDHGARPDGAAALLLGAGGAGRAIAVALLDAGVRELTIHDPDQTRVEALVDVVGDVGRGRIRVGPADPTGFDLVCNATPLGMADDDPLPLDPTLLVPSTFVGDVVAGHGLTPLLAAAQAAGCHTAGGGHMVEAAQDVMADFLLRTDSSS